VYPEDPPRIIAQQAGRGRTEQVDDPPRGPGIDRGRNEKGSDLIDRPGGDERRQQPPGTSRPDLRQRGEVGGADIVRCGDPRARQRRGERPAEAGPEPRGAERLENRI
jgi:hypothetical protein